MKDTITNEERLNLISVLDSYFADKEAKKSTILVSREATAKRLHVNVSTLWRWGIAKYPICPIKIGGKVWYRESDIVKLENGIITE